MIAQSSDWTKPVLYHFTSRYEMVKDVLRI